MNKKTKQEECVFHFSSDLIAVRALIEMLEKTYGVKERELFALSVSLKNRTHAVMAQLSDRLRSTAGRLEIHTRSFGDELDSHTLFELKLDFFHELRVRGKAYSVPEVLHTLVVVDQQSAQMEHYPGLNVRAFDEAALTTLSYLKYLTQS